MSTATLTRSDAIGRIRPRAVVLVAAIGPLTIAALRGLLPYDTIDDSTTLVEKVAAHPAPKPLCCGSAPSRCSPCRRRCWS